MTSITNCLKLSNISCERQDRILFKALDLEAKSGELIRIMGKNGSGKSSLLKIITGLLRPVTGQVCWNDTDIILERSHFVQNLTYIGHKPAIKSDLSVMENLSLLLGFSGQAFTAQDIEQTLVRLDLYDFRSIQAGYLSQGQQRRIGLCRLWLEQTKLWVLDEPYTSVDKQAIELINETINLAIEKGVIVIFTSHQESTNLMGDIKKVHLDS